MRKPKLTNRPEPSARITDHSPQKGLDIATAEPDLLRDSVRVALSGLSDKEWTAVNKSLLDMLKRAGVNVGLCLLLLGIPATTPDKLTEPEIASLIRYVRINEPTAIALIAPVLSEILSRNFEPARGAMVTTRAA